MELEEVKKLVINPGEILVVRYSEDKDDSFFRAAQDQFKRYLPGVRVLIVAGVAEITVISQEDEPKLKRKYTKAV